MNQIDVKQLLNELCEATKEAVTYYIDNSGESTDQMPEFVMSTGAARRLSAIGVPTILEANAETLRRRIAAIDNKEMDTKVGVAIEGIGGGKIDLVLLSVEGDPKDRKPIGFVEFKKWKYDAGDAQRVAGLLSGIPGAQFGACVVLRDAPASDPWHRKIKNSLESSGDVITRDVMPKTRAGKSRCIAVFARFRPSPRASFTV